MPTPPLIKAEPDPGEGTTLGNLVQSRIHRAFTTLCDDLYGLGKMSTEERIALSSSIGDSLDLLSEAMEKQGILDRSVSLDTAERLVELEKRVRMAFSSIGGKKSIAKKLIEMFPEHETYVEPFSGGLAVFFAKDPSPKEAVSDMNPRFVRAYQTIQKLSDADIATLAKRDWTITREHFNSIRDSFRKNEEKNDLDWLYEFLYLRHGVFGAGDPSKAVDVSRIGKRITVVDDLPDIRDRLQKAKVVRADARRVIRALDSPGTFFYLDPPYPVGSGERKDYDIGEFSRADLSELFELLKGIKGKFLMSLPGALRKMVPSEFDAEYIDTPVLQGRRRMRSRELVIANYDGISKSQPGASDAHVNSLLDEEKFEIVKSEKSMEKGLVYLIAMKPNFVDYEGQWANTEAIESAAHRWLLKGGPVWLEHEVDVSDKVKPVESYIAPLDFDMWDRHIQKGTWIVGLKVLDEKIRKAILDGEFRGGSVRGPATVVPDSRPEKEAA